jgi:hypothetical protein
MNATLAFGIHPKISNHCVVLPNIFNKMQYLNLDVKLIITNEYEKQITMTPFELLTFIDNAIPI